MIPKYLPKKRQDKKLNLQMQRVYLQSKSNRTLECRKQSSPEFEHNLESVWPEPRESTM